MPELPEVETTATHLNKEVKNKIIKGLWTDWPKYFSARGGPAFGGKLARGERGFKKILLGRKILSVGRKGKNILFYLSGGYVVLAHQKMTGHFLVGKWRETSRKEKPGEIWLGQKWVPVNQKGPLGDDRNRFIRLILFLSGGEMLALSDLRRFAKFALGPEKEILGLPEVKELGPEPIDPEFTFGKFFDLLRGRKGKIKPLLLDQNLVSGVGNIYADESLWYAKIHPLRQVEGLTRTELLNLYNALRLVLKRAIKFRGSSVDDYRDPSGRPGFYHLKHEVYHREGERCRRCGTEIRRIKIGQRSAHFCPKCQI